MINEGTDMNLNFVYKSSDHLCCENGGLVSGPQIWAGRVIK